MPFPVSLRSRSARSSLACCGLAALLALGGALGCSKEPRGPRTAASPYAGAGYPLVAPTQPILLVQPGERRLGPLRPATEAELQIIKKAFPFGTVTIESSSVDSDAVLRLASPARSSDGRAVEHRESVRRTQAIGVTEDGFVRFRVDYARDGSLWIEHGQRVGKPSAVEGKSYLLDVSKNGLRVLTSAGLTPSAEEVAIIQEDHADLGRRPKQDEDAPLRSSGGSVPAGAAATPLPVKATDLVKSTLGKALEKNGYFLDALTANLQGVRDVEGVPCAMFTIAIAARRQKNEQEKTTWTQIQLGGEYALRLSDGWEAEVLLSGSTTNTTQGAKDGMPLTVSSAAFTRIHVRTSYTAPDPDTVRSLDKLRRERTP